MNSITQTKIMSELDQVFEKSNKCKNENKKIRCILLNIKLNKLNILLKKEEEPEPEPEEPEPEPEPEEVKKKVEFNWIPKVKETKEPEYKVIAKSGKNFNENWDSEQYQELEQLEVDNYFQWYRIYWGRYEKLWEQLNKKRRIRKLKLKKSFPNHTELVLSLRMLKDRVEELHNAITDKSDEGQFMGYVGQRKINGKYKLY